MPRPRSSRWPSSRRRSRPSRRSRPPRPPLPTRRGTGPAAAPVDPLMAQLTKLARLHAAGILSDEEFAAAKAKALGL